MNVITKPGPEDVSDVYSDDRVIASVLLRDVREFSDLVIDGSSDARQAIVEKLESMNGLAAARLIIDALTHHERIIGFDDLGTLEEALGLDSVEADIKPWIASTSDCQKQD